MDLNLKPASTSETVSWYCIAVEVSGRTEVSVLSLYPHPPRPILIGVYHGSVGPWRNEICLSFYIFCCLNSTFLITNCHLIWAQNAKEQSVFSIVSDPWRRAEINFIKPGSFSLTTMKCSEAAEILVLCVWKQIRMQNVIYVYGRIWSLLVRANMKYLRK